MCAHIALADGREPAYGKPAARFASLVTTVQDALGDHQDCVVATDVLHALARKSVGQGHAFELGRAVQVLVDREAQRERFHELWPDVRRARHRRWLVRA